MSPRAKRQTNLRESHPHLETEPPMNHKLLMTAIFSFEHRSLLKQNCLIVRKRERKKKKSGKNEASVKPIEKILETYRVRARCELTRSDRDDPMSPTLPPPWPWKCPTVFHGVTKQTRSALQ